MLIKSAGIVVVILAALVAIVLVIAASRPKSIRVQRSILINAPAEKVFPLINDFHQWSLWAPQDMEDSTMRRTFSGAENGAGAISDWQSSGSAGTGTMSITESQPLARVVVKTAFVKPFVAHNLNEFVLEPAGAATRVTWTLQGENLFVMRVMGVFMNMDQVMGKHFEAGLDHLKTAAESE